MAKHIHIVAIQSIIPGKVTDTASSRTIKIDAPLRDEALQSHLRVVLYYENNAECSAVAMAAWTKESLTAVLSEHPVLAGRLRRDREEEGCWEIKFNDAGVRILQATAEVSMAELLKMEDREEGERALAYWMDVDRERPEISALFYIQVTEFQGDGYSIGISCSLLLADPLFLAQFLKKWAVANCSMLAQAHPKFSIFHLSYFTRPKHPNYLKSFPLDSAQTNHTTKTILFKLPWALNQSADQITSLASFCIREATQRLKSEHESKPEPKHMSKFSILVNDPAGELSVGSCRTGELVHSDVFGRAISVASLDELGLDELVLSEGNMPVRVSCRVVTCEHEGMVVVMMPGRDDGVLEVMVSVTVPMKK